MCILSLLLALLTNTLRPPSHAHYALGNYRAAADAYKKGVELDPKNDNLKSGLKSALERVPADEDDSPPPLIPEDQLRSTSPPMGSARGPGAGAVPDLSSLANMFGNMGGAGAGRPGAGGTPDLTSLMNNPMMMQMAQQLMANGGLERLMSNPALANMVRVFPHRISFLHKDFLAGPRARDPLCVLCR